jgi:PAS domain S-box-containing protein
MTARPARLAPVARGRRGSNIGAAQYRRIAEHAPVMVWAAGPDRRCAYLNRRWVEFTGRPAREHLGDGWLECVHPDDRVRCFEAFSNAFAEARAFEIECRLRRADGEHRRMLARGEPLLDGDEPAGLVAVLHDVTERMHEDERRAQMLARERNARAHAESASLARDQFLALVSHELRSPLNGIKSWTHVLENLLHDASAPVRRALAGIMIGVEHQVRLIEDLFDVTRAMSGTLGLVKHRMPIEPVLVDAVEDVRAEAIAKDLRIVTDYGLGSREMHGDPDRVRQVFTNLLANAIKFTPPGGTIHVSARAEDAMACIEVADDGVGIPAEFMPYLFDPFRQVEGASNRRQEGLGLGLALVQRLSELHGGHASCESAGVDRGATFRVYLPLRREGESSGDHVVLPDSHRGGQGASALPSLDGIRVLLIDDQREARESLGALLTQAGAQVDLAGSSLEAIACLDSAAHDDRPEVVVCDIAMPNEDGYATLKRIRAWEAAHGLPECPAVALTAFTQREDRARALAEGFRMHLTKPVAPAEIVIVIASAARRTRR